jgi:hypothetical protein
MGYNTSAGAVSNISSGGEYDSPDIGSNSTYTIQSAAEAAAAALSASQAAASATGAIDAYESFDDRYLGSKAVDPTLDNDGNALLTGALYYNNGTVSPGVQGMRVYTGTFWTATYTTAPGYGALIATNNLGDVDSAALSRINLGVTATGVDSTYNFRTNNLSDVSSVSTARTNLGVTATGVDTTYAYRANNLSDLASASTARTNLGLGTAAVASTTDFDAAGTAVAMAIALA